MFVYNIINMMQISMLKILSYWIIFDRLDQVKMFCILQTFFHILQPGDAIFDICSKNDMKMNEQNQKKISSLGELHYQNHIKLEELYSIW